MYLLEKSVYDKQIEQARTKYGVKINKIEVQQEKLNRTMKTLDDDETNYQRDMDDLNQYEEHFNAKMSEFNDEFKDLHQLEKYLLKTTKVIDEQMEVK